METASKEKCYYQKLALTLRMKKNPFLRVKHLQKVPRKTKILENKKVFFLVTMMFLM